ncbi:MAG: hypothetical protein AB7T27_05695 [Kiritimatiellia bacterium]
MNNVKFPLLILVIIVNLLVCLSSLADNIALINYQGRLVHNGVLVNGNIDMIFRIYTNQATGTFIYEQTNDVMVIDGIYNVGLGMNSTFGDFEAAIMNDDCYVEVVINGNPLRPRERITPPPFAKKSSQIWSLFGGFYHNLRQYPTIHQSQIPLASGIDCSLGNWTYGVFPPVFMDVRITSARVKYYPQINWPLDSSALTTYRLLSKTFDATVTNLVATGDILYSSFTNGWQELNLSSDKSVCNLDGDEFLYFEIMLPTSTSSVQGTYFFQVEVR